MTYFALTSVKNRLFSCSAALLTDAERHTRRLSPDKVRLNFRDLCGRVGCVSVCYESSKKLALSGLVSCLPLSSSDTFPTFFPMR